MNHPKSPEDPNVATRLPETGTTGPRNRTNTLESLGGARGRVDTVESIRDLRRDAAKKNVPADVVGTRRGSRREDGDIRAEKKVEEEVKRSRSLSEDTERDLRQTRSEVAIRQRSEVPTEPPEQSKSTPPEDELKGLALLISKTKSILGEKSIFNADPPRPVNQNNIPFGMSRWIVLTLYCFYQALSGVIWYNWAPVQEMLIEDGAYAWKCEGGIPGCDAQKSALSLILTFAVSGQYMLTFVGGFIIDFFGPRWSSVTGFTFIVAGYTMFAFSSETLPMYVPGAVLSTAGSDPVFLAVANIGNLFPGFNGTVIGLLVTFRSLPFAYPIITKSIWQAVDIKYQYFLLIHAAISVTALISCFFCVPNKSYLSDEELELQGLLDYRDQIMTLENTLVSNMSVLSAKLAHSSSGGSSVPDEATKVPDSPSPKQAEDRDVESGLPDRMLSGSTIFYNPRTAKELSPFREFLNYVWSPFYLLFVPHYIIVFTRQQVFFNITPDLFVDTADFLSLANSFSAFCCPIFGFLADHYGAIWLLHFLNFCALILFFLLLYPVIWSQWLAILFQYPLVVFWGTHLFLYLHSMFPQRHIGKLFGLVAFFAGLIGLTASPLYAFSLSFGSFWPVVTLMIGLTVLTGVLIAVLDVKYRRFLRLNNHEFSIITLD